jgi:2-hydroxycyclohexanecarboxyl-CoA dehydrogenase
MSARRALVTGAGQGIGAAIAARLVADRLEVVVTDVDGASAQRCAQDLGTSGFALDVTDFEAVHAAVDRLGRVDVLVNNAGVDDFGWFTETDPSRWRKILAVNLEGALNCTHAVLPGMQAAAAGRVVNVSSEAGRIGSKGNAVYAAAKGGLIAFTKSLARENGRYGITVNAVAPGPIDTPLLHDMSPHAIDVVTASTQLGRLGDVAEVAAAVSFLVSDDAAFITGETLGVSGGMALGG